MTNDNFVHTSGYLQVVGGGTVNGNATITTSCGSTIGDNCTPTVWIQPTYWPTYYPNYWPTYYPTNEAALRETIREKEAVIEEMRELVKMQRRLLDAILPKDAGE